MRLAQVICGRKAVEILSVFGRGIEKVIVGSRWRWLPTRYIEKLDKNGRRTGYRSWAAQASKDDKRIVVAGGNANVLAAAHYFKSAREKPGIVVFAAGRPPYLTGEPSWLTEGRVMKAKFLRLVHDIGRTETITFDNNKNTGDDMRETLLFAKEKGASNVTIVSVLVHLPRAEEFAKRIVAENSGLAGLNVRFLSAEEILASRHRLYGKIFKSGLKSAAWARTAMLELRGIEALRSGNYGKNHEAGRYGSVNAARASIPTTQKTGLTREEVEMALNQFDLYKSTLRGLSRRIESEIDELVDGDWSGRDESLLKIMNYARALEKGRAAIPEIEKILTENAVETGLIRKQ